ncbi:MAG: preprotein translocase subunit SecG [Candidatus Muirbacterium halophilum]|nr:preprotein translocase subunit SecG [Candidatus Muirbacterium halophilum]MCK9475407.1 preprotein translocase subunit SecG [Candidatus Muirbacterium halophilum]
MEFGTLTWVILGFHTLIALGLIIVVLLQADKGEGLSGAFGGGAAQTMFGAKGSLDFFGKLTTVFAVIFIITSFTLTYMATQNFRAGSSNIAPVPQSQSK